MRDRMVTKILSIVMMVVFPASIVMADTKAAMLYASGHAMLNGAEVARSTAVFVGDKIQTPQDSAASINASGSIVLVPANSLVQFKGDGIDLQSGSASISTTKGLKAQVGTLTVRPVNGSAKFQVTSKDGNVLVAARTGSLSLTDASGTTYLQEGGTTTTTSDDKKDRKKGGAVPGIGGTGTALGSGMGTTTAVLIGLAAAAAAATIAFLSIHSPDQVSPVRP